MAPVFLNGKLGVAWGQGAYSRSHVRIYNYAYRACMWKFTHVRASELRVLIMSTHTLVYFTCMHLYARGSNMQYARVLSKRQVVYEAVIWTVNYKKSVKKGCFSGMKVFYRNLHIQNLEKLAKFSKVGSICKINSNCSQKTLNIHTHEVSTVTLWRMRRALITAIII